MATKEVWWARRAASLNSVTEEAQVLTGSSNGYGSVLVAAALAALVVALVDLNLPDGSGADLIKDLRDARPRATALVLSAMSEQRYLAEAIEAGATSWKRCAVWPPESSSSPSRRS
jgi:DNA-binding NarL/FixJ family response regulator